MDKYKCLRCDTEGQSYGSFLTNKNVYAENILAMDKSDNCPARDFPQGYATHVWEKIPEEFED